MKLSALLYFVLSLFGCDVGRSTFVDRVVVDGANALVSRATVEAGVARFECLRSASGHCYYTVFPRECATSQSSGKVEAACLAQPIGRFTVANGDSRQVTGLNDFRLCVSDKDGTPGTGCQAPEPVAAR
ncbi:MULTISPECIES: hypothetical protein [unclassified Lysobacter]|uniref:hypothetical protein n=1 Tax=unclassified Lysobacter TaxID=2635362 RepID=UPI001C23AF3D|nr:hypothetical protein [Lysobacter sp. MMG2]MBU8977412.1 hypothetical protein [Lysobacter sp. MMG2]